MFVVSKASHAVEPLSNLRHGGQDSRRLTMRSSIRSLQTELALVEDGLSNVAATHQLEGLHEGPSRRSQRVLDDEVAASTHLLQGQVDREVHQDAILVTKPLKRSSQAQRHELGPNAAWEGDHQEVGLIATHSIKAEISVITTVKLKPVFSDMFEPVECPRRRAAFMMGSVSV